MERWPYEPQVKPVEQNFHSQVHHFSEYSAKSLYTQSCFSSQEEKLALYAYSRYLETGSSWLWLVSSLILVLFWYSLETLAVLISPISLFAHTPGQSRLLHVYVDDNTNVGRSFDWWCNDPQLQAYPHTTWICCCWATSKTWNIPNIEQLNFKNVWDVKLTHCLKPRNSNPKREITHSALQYCSMCWKQNILRDTATCSASDSFSPGDQKLFELLEWKPKSQVVPEIEFSNERIQAELLKLFSSKMPVLLKLGVHTSQI